MNASSAAIDPTTRTTTEAAAIRRNCTKRFMPARVAHAGPVAKGDRSTPSASRSRGGRALTRIVDRQVEDAIAALDPAEVALADHHTGSLEVAGHRRARRGVDEMHPARPLPRLDPIAQPDRRLE